MTGAIFALSLCPAPGGRCPREDGLSARLAPHPSFCGCSHRTHPLQPDYGGRQGRYSCVQCNQLCLDKPSIQKINEKTLDLNCMLDQVDLTFTKHSIQKQQNTHSPQGHTEHSPG